MHPFLADLHLGRRTPQELLEEIVERLHATSTPDEELCLELGVGDLESLLSRHETELWPRIERLARDDERFRRALAAVWADESPESDRRHELLEALGEFWTVTVRFVAMRDDFGDPPRLSWRARETEPPMPSGQLPELLRSIANSIEAEERRQDDPSRPT